MPKNAETAQKLSPDLNLVLCAAVAKRLVLRFFDEAVQPDP
ncbi:hypothetical protein [Lysinibacter cavernae]